MEIQRQKQFKRLIRRINWYPPFLFSGIKLIDHSEDFTWFKTQLKVRWWNKNLVGTAFGGSLYSMCDPFFMFILMINLGDQYIIWDKHAFIDFQKPGKGTVFAEFKLSQQQIEEVKQVVAKEGSYIFEFPCQIQNSQGEQIARLKKGVYVKRKDFKGDRLSP